MTVKKFHMAKQGDDAEILIYDVIGESWFGGVSSATVKAQLDELGPVRDATIRINSEGGDIYEGYAIYNHIRNAKIENRIVEIDALAASAASVIALAGDTVNMAGNAWFMIHKPITIVAGDDMELERQVLRLRSLNDQAANIYANHSDMSADEALDYMTEETWWDAEGAKAIGLIDGITNPLKVAAQLDPSRFKHTPPALLKRVEPALVSSRLASMKRRIDRIGARAS